jgi:hypothetical protein
VLVLTMNHVTSIIGVWVAMTFDSVSWFGEGNRRRVSVASMQRNLCTT